MCFYSQLFTAYYNVQLVLYHILFIVLLDSFFDFHDRDNASHADVLCGSNPNLCESNPNGMFSVVLTLMGQVAVMKGNRAKVAAWEGQQFGACSSPDWIDCDLPPSLQTDIQRVTDEQSAAVNPFSFGYGALKRWILREGLLPADALKQCRSPAAMLRAVHTCGGWSMNQAQMSQLAQMEREDSSMRQPTNPRQPPNPRIP